MQASHPFIHASHLQQHKQEVVNGRGAELPLKLLHGRAYEAPFGTLRRIPSQILDV
jgi:hypothetical protein